MTTSPADVNGLPAIILPGEFGFEYLVDFDGDQQWQEIRFRWDGGRTATWREDISSSEGISPMSTAPSVGWASWLNGADLLIAYANAEGGFEAWARIPGGAPTADAEDHWTDDDLHSNPARWLALARTISRAVMDRGPEGMTSGQFGSE